MPAKTAKPRRMTVSDELRTIIRAGRLTPYSVATSAGAAPSVLTRFMNRERGLTLDTFDAIAEALGLKPVESSGRGKGRARPDPPAVPPDVVPIDRT
jgi:hypothetical protein